MIDSHTHIDFDRFDPDRGEMLERARAAGVTRMVNIALGTTPEKYARSLAIVEKEPDVVTTIGFHPHDASQFTEATPALLQSLLSHERVVGIGEVGLDYHYDNSPREEQRSCFRAMLNLAIEKNLPVSIHSREAFDDTLTIVRETNIFERVGAVMHCFTGNAEEAKAFLDLGAMISFSGIISFKKAEEIQQAARMVPFDRILIETDAPFLAPVPHRGQRNEPGYVRYVAETLASLRGMRTSEIIDCTTENTCKLFRL